MAQGRIAMIFIETPSNPMNSLVDIALVSTNCRGHRARQGSRPIAVCDNTLLGPCSSRRSRHGADLSLYSLTKYVGGHSDLIGGAILGSAADLKPIRAMRSAIGTQLDPHSCWMLARSLETLSLRMSAPPATRRSSPTFSPGIPEVACVHYPPLLPPTTRTQVDGEAVEFGRLDILLRGQRRSSGGVRFPQSPSGIQVGGQSRRNGIFDLPSDDDSAFRAHRNKPVVRSESPRRWFACRSGIEHPDDLIADIARPSDNHALLRRRRSAEARRQRSTARRRGGRSANSAQRRRRHSSGQVSS